MNFRPGLLLALALPLFADDVQVGDSRDVVIKKLGKPIGRMALGPKEMLSYERGYVEIQDGKASLVRIVTAEKVEADRLAREEAAQAAEAEYQQRVAMTEEAKTALLADETFKTNSAAEKVARWEEFKQSHPDATAPEEYNKALEQKHQERQAEEEAALAAQTPKPKPKLSSSKRRRYIRAHNTNMVDIAEAEEEP